MQVLDSSTSARSELLVEGVQALGLRHLGGGSESQVLSERLLEWKLADADLWSG